MYYKIIISILMLVPFGFTAMGQQQHEFDSLTTVYWSSKERNNTEVLKEIVRLRLQPDTTIKYANRLIKEAKNYNDQEMLRYGYHNKGVAYRYKGEYQNSFNFLFKSAELAETLENNIDLAITFVELGNSYAESGDLRLSSIYFNRGIELFEQEDNKLFVGMTYYNMGDSFFDKAELDSSFVYTTRSIEIFRELGRTHYEAYSLGNLGRINLARKDYNQAEKQLRQAIKVLEEKNDYNALTDFYSAISELKEEKGDLPGAINYAEKSLQAAKADGLKEDLHIAHQKLASLNELAGNTSESYEHYKMFVEYKDSLENYASIREIANLRSDYEISRKQTEVDLLNEQKANQRNIVFATGFALFLIMLLALGLYRRNRYIGRTKKIIENEKNRSDRLLLNILPLETAIELKENGKVKAKRFDAVTILFTDFKNFTHFAENLPPEELVKSVDFYFSKFDEIVEQHGLEKIKTVGDAYMCAAGVPFPVEDHAVRIVKAACDMIHFVQDAQKKRSETETRFEMRIGINSGPVVAGVVGSKKWAYDIWGDAVNIAARMEGCSQNGRINISENTYNLVKDDFECDYRGEIKVKNKGMMKMYFVKDKKLEESSNLVKEEVLKM